MLSLLIATIATFPAPLPPFAFSGRVTDYAHIAYDANAKVEVRVKTTDGKLIAKTYTSTSGNTSYNFAVNVPLSTDTSDGRVTPGTRVVIDFVDPDGIVYSGLISEGDSVIGNPGEIKSLTVALATDSDGDGVSDEYVAALAYLMWKNGKSNYDAAADWDGDGVSNYAEYVAGTNPFDATDKLSIQKMAMEEGGGDFLKLTFPVTAGRTYTVKTTDDLKDGEWVDAKFWTEAGSDTGVVRINTGNEEFGYKEIFVLQEGVKRFWKIAVE